MHLHLTSLFQILPLVLSHPQTPKRDPSCVLADSRSAISTPTYGTGGLFAVYTSAFISARPSEILSLILHTHTWQIWNPFVPSATVLTSPDPSGYTTGILAVNMTLDFHTTLFSNGTVVDSIEEVLVLTPLADVPETQIIDGIWQEGDEGWLVCWAGMDAPSVLLEAERCTVLISVDGEGGGEAGTRYVSYETYYGPLAAVLQATTEDALVEKFGEWARGLKGYVEGVASC